MIKYWLFTIFKQLIVLKTADLGNWSDIEICACN
jgi:hypothetical protein